MRHREVGSPCCLGQQQQPELFSLSPYPSWMRKVVGLGPPGWPEPRRTDRPEVTLPKSRCCGQCLNSANIPTDSGMQETWAKPTGSQVRRHLLGPAWAKPRGSQVRRLSVGLWASAASSSVWFWCRDCRSVVKGIPHFVMARKNYGKRHML